MLKYLEKVKGNIVNLWDKWNHLLPRFLKVSHDGGKNSGVSGFWLIEWKPVCSVVLLKFNKGTRDAYHEHAFNALTFWIKGEVLEEFEDGSKPMLWKPSWKPKFTPRSNYHRINAQTTSWALCFRGPWKNVWKERRGSGEEVTLTYGRKVVQ